MRHLKAASTFLVLLVLLLAPLEALAQIGPRLLWDSESVAGGALVQSPILDLARAKAEVVELFIDNTAANSFNRALTVTSYLQDGTQFDSVVVLPSVPLGGAPTGSTYPLGLVRALMGPIPPTTEDGAYLLYDETSAVNTFVQSPTLFTMGFSRVSISGLLNGSLGTVPTLQVSSDVWTIKIPGASLNAGEALQYVVGPGILQTADAPTTKFYAGGVNLPLGQFFNASYPAAGASLTMRLRITGHGRPPGTFAYQMILPPKIRFSLSAGGTGAARMMAFAL